MPVNPATWERFERNLERANGLLNLYSYFVRHRRGRPPTPLSDVLRAAVVFVHASLEEFLRSLAAQYWPATDSTALDHVPLLHLAPSTKHTVRALTRYRGRTVDALIVDSVQAHLENSSFNNTGDVAGLVQSIGVDVARVNGWFPELQELMERRHHVVHQSDRNEPLRRGHHRTRALSNGQVSRWLLVVVAFAGAVTSELEGEAPRPGAQ